MGYPGGKGRAYHFLISLIPLHETYIETHLGGGSVLRRKRPAARSIGIDSDPAVAARWRAEGREGLEIVEGDAVAFLSSHRFDGTEFVYADPPYWPAARRRRRCYRHDYTESQHEELIEQLTRLPCPVMLSGYANPLYDAVLGHWVRREHSSPTHVGRVPETVWMNFEPCRPLHDYRYVGADFRARELMRRRAETQLRRLARACPVERQAIICEIVRTFPEELKAAMAIAS